MSTTLIERLEAVIATGEVSRSGLARAAGLHPNSLRKLGSPDWNPTADTLTRLEKLIQRGSTEVLVGPEAIINEARNGRMFILVDDDDRENEGDLVIPAQMATPDAVNFMARHGRGLICLALTKERADQLGLEPMAWFHSWAAAGCDPSRMGIGPVPAVEKLFARNGLDWKDIDLVELNEAFAPQVLACLKGWNWDDRDKLNVNGSGISLGHPIGATGGRILANLVRELRRRDGRYGLETMCIGGGQGLAAVFERA